MGERDRERERVKGRQIEKEMMERVRKTEKEGDFFFTVGFSGGFQY